ncbi:MAG: XRE family transcriptional regulator [Victivallales bacterium]|nr:XRE family transcriptional regulator [Victivallales bacterium]
MKYRFGDKLRQVRRRAGMTMKEVAARAGVSESLISQIERDRISPAIDTLLTLAEILHVDMDYLFGDLRREQTLHVVHRQERRKLIQHGVTLELLSRMPDMEDHEHGIEAYYMAVAPGCESGSDVYGHRGRELGTIISGCGELHIGRQVLKLKAGDTISFASDTPHKFRNCGDKALEAFWVITPPKLWQ